MTETAQNDVGAGFLYSPSTQPRPCTRRGTKSAPSTAVAVPLPRTRWRLSELIPNVIVSFFSFIVRVDKLVFCCSL